MGRESVGVGRRVQGGLGTSNARFADGESLRVHRPLEATEPAVESFVQSQRITQYGVIDMPEASDEQQTSPSPEGRDCIGESGVQPAAKPKDPYIERFLQDRDSALLSLDEGKLRAYMRKYGETPPSNPIVFWVGVHKAITGCMSLPIEFRRASAMWLAVRGYKSMDDGDLAINAASSTKRDS